MAGYSETPLAQKLGIKAGEQIVSINPPKNYSKLIGPLPARVRIDVLGRGCSRGRRPRPKRFVHFFTTKRSELRRELKSLRTQLDEAGAVWVSWPKKSSGVLTDVTEDVVRAEALPLGFVDVKVCAVDQTWSGLKLMVRRTERSTAK